MRKLLRFGAGVLGVLLLFVAMLPWLLYELGLSRFDKLPASPAQLATAEEQAQAWARARGAGMPKIEPMNPYSFVFNFFTRDPAHNATPGESVAHLAASDYALQQRPMMGNAHLERVALAIWLTRHWTTEELLTAAAHPVVITFTPRKPRPVSAEP
ncbi:hypothetical protein [Roseateles sp. P5_E7]